MKLGLHITLKSEFEVTIGCEDDVLFVGMEILRNRKEKDIYIHQEAYAKNVVYRFNMALAITSSTPADPKLNLCAPDDHC